MLSISRIASAVMPKAISKVDFLPNHVLEKNRFRMRLELQSCYVTVHVTGTSALGTAVFRVLAFAMSRAEVPVT